MNKILLVPSEQNEIEKKFQKHLQRFEVFQNLSLYGFTILRAIRDSNYNIIDFEWEYANRIACEILKYSYAELIGSRLLEKLPGNRDNLFPLYVKVMQTGEPHNIELFYSDGNVDGWFKNMTVKVDDNVAVLFFDITDRKNKEKELNEAYKKLKEVYSRISDGVIALDKDLTIVFINDSVDNFLPDSKSYLFKNIRDIVTDVEKNRLLRDLENSLQTQSSLRFDYYSQLVCKWFTISVYPSPEGLSLYVVDITPKKVAEAKLEQLVKEKELIIKESHHRIKNNLQLMVSLLNLGSSNAKDPETKAILTDNLNRVISISTLHQYLYRSNDYNQVNVQNYLYNVLDYIRASLVTDIRNIKILKDIENFNIDSNLAISLGLVINELITNAVKYAFGQKGEGIISLELKQSQSYILINIKDNGIGMAPGIDLINTESLGFQIVTSLVDQHNGQIDYKVENGTEFMIKLPHTVI